MDYMGVRGISALLLSTSLAFALILTLKGGTLGRRLGTAGMLIAIVLLAGTAPLYARLYDRLLFNQRHAHFVHVVENRSGVVTVTDDRKVYGGGVHYFNATSSEEAYLSGVSVFRYGLRIASFLAVSDAPIVLDRRTLDERLRGYRIDDKPVLDLRDTEQQRTLDALLTSIEKPPNVQRPAGDTYEPGESLRRRLAGVRVITDANMGSEWR